MPDLIELQKDKTLFEAKTEEVSLHKQIKQQENQIPPPEPEYERKQKQLSWTIAPQLQEKEMLKGAERAKFAKNEQLEQSMNEEEQILLKREEQSFQSLEKLFQEIHQPARHGLMFRRVLRKISQEMEQALQIFHAIQENKEEIFYEDSDGNEKSYEPPRYTYEYEFNVTIFVDSPWFDKIELELSDGNRPDSRYSDLYREYEQKMLELADILMNRKDMSATYDGPGPGMFTVVAHNPTPEPSPVPAAPPIDHEEWICPSCGAQNDGKFCKNCGCQKPAAMTIHCESCDSDIEYRIKPPKFCPECGNPFR